MMNELSGFQVDVMRRNRSIEKNKWKVDDFVSIKRPNYMAHESSGPSESESSEDGKSQYSSNRSIDDELPELVVFLQETNYEFVKDICIDKAVTSHGKCFEENCDINGSAPGLFKRNIVDNDSESSEESEDLESSISSMESADILEKNMNEVTEQRRVCSDASNELSFDLSKKKVAPKLPLLDREAAVKRIASSPFSIAMSLSKLLDDNRESNIERGKLVSMFCSSKLSVSTVGSSSRRKADCQHCHECESTTMAEDSALEKQTGEYKSHNFVYHCNHREISSVALDPVSSVMEKPSLSSYIRSVSLRSNSSTNSSHSFAFPILQTEWNGSPERMLNASPIQPRRHRLWRMCFPCCKF